MIEAASNLILENVSLAEKTSFHAGGIARFYAEVNDRDQLAECCEFAYRNGFPILILGRGTNLLVANEGVRGMVICLKGTLARLDFDGCTVRAGAGTMMGALQIGCIRNGLSGLEGCMGVPGTIGGAIVGNAGTPLGTISDVVTSVTVFDGGRFLSIPAEKCGFGYRRSNLARFIILECELALRKTDKVSVRDSCLDVLKKRLNHPRGRTAGSVFKNPQPLFAGKLIEAAGLKGRRCGDAYISPKHANFIVNDGNNADDIMTLIKECQIAVFAKFGVRLEPELKLWGFGANALEVMNGLR